LTRQRVEEQQVFSITLSSVYPLATLVHPLVHHGRGKAIDDFAEIFFGNSFYSFVS
jgi:hypothetical protein